MISPQIRYEKLVEIRAPKSTVRRLAQRQVLNVLADQLKPSVGCHPVNAIGGVSSHIEIALPVESQAVRDPGDSLGVDLRRASTAIRHDFHSHNTVEVALHHVEVFLRRVQGEPIGEVEGPGGEEFSVTIARESEDDAVSALPFPGIAEIQVAL